jgi:hypothetical protein
MNGATQERTRETRLPMAGELAERVEKLLTVDRMRYRRLWAYCRNPMRTGVVVDESGSEKPYVQAQEWGLPSRITGIKSGGEIFEGELLDGLVRKEVVIENDIGWRIDTMVDYLFGKPLVIESTAPDPRRRKLISELLRLILGHNGGILMLQQLALLGSVHGFVDVLVKLTKCDEGDGRQVCVGRRRWGSRQAGRDPGREGPDRRRRSMAKRARSIRRRVHRAREWWTPSMGRKQGPRRKWTTRRGHESRINSQHGARRMRRLKRLGKSSSAWPGWFGWRSSSRRGRCRFCAGGLEEGDGVWAGVGGSQRGFRVRFGCAHRGRGAGFRKTRILGESAARGGEVSEQRRWERQSRAGGDEEKSVVVELITEDRWWRIEDGKVVESGPNSLGRIPVVHIQNSAVPFEYSGRGMWSRWFRCRMS